MCPQNEIKARVEVRRSGLHSGSRSNSAAGEEQGRHVIKSRVAFLGEQPAGCRRGRKNVKVVVSQQSNLE